ncbi:hypothetical protein GB937_004315 [Aspergillus fischeri]|nr:hypothetical protein GB937_004315 [Aspergillus fischeri]
MVRLCQISLLSLPSLTDSRLAIQTPVRFPTLRHMIILLATALQGDFGRESYLRHIPYTDVVSLFDSIDSFTEVLLGTVDPTIRNLEGRIITRSLYVQSNGLILDEVRQAQAKHETQWPLNSGYLDYVSDDRDPDYWRPYVGQSSNTEQRIAQHVRAIRTGDTDTLHYFVIRRGDGHRTANFIRLWTLALPENVDPVINNALNNILEMIMAPIRAEIKPHGQKHPQRWAYHVTSDDPASRLAFRLTVMGPENQEFGFYASGRGTKLVKKANGFIDWMSGVTDEEIATRPRRYLNIQMSHEKVHEALRPFVGGAYTDDNGNIMKIMCWEEFE